MAQLSCPLFPFILSVRSVDQGGTMLANLLRLQRRHKAARGRHRRNTVTKVTESLAYSTGDPGRAPGAAALPTLLISIQP
jgi:hypothetical protein